jgi:L-aspartate oxidase
LTPSSTPAPAPDGRFALGLESPLRAFDRRRVPQYRCDLVVVGSGAAGCAAALAAARAGAEVVVLSKAGIDETNTVYAQGGLAAVVGEEDTFESHIADTLSVGCGLAEREVVERTVRGGPEAVRQLLEWGAEFDRREDGSLDLSREGGHTRPRILHARGDATGREIQRAVRGAIEADPRITEIPDTFVVDLLRSDDGRVTGVLAHTAANELVAFGGGQVVLASGGGGQLYRETTNPVIATGDGVALGVRAGAVVRDLEFVQFHPTLLYIAGAARVLISEIVRGAGGVLRDRNGERFMPAFHPDAELAPRDVVSRAVFHRMVETDDTSVYLDLSHVDGDPHALFPGISRVCRWFGMDIAKDPVPVRPGAHYMIGGLRADGAGRTTVPGLWAVGECASTGLHGANRMGSNSLLEALVDGTAAGRAAAEEGVTLDSAGRPARPSGEVRSGHAALSNPAPAGIRVNIQDVTYSLKSLMWRQMGIERDARMLEAGLASIELWTRAVHELAPPEPRSWELLNMLTVARLATLGALARTESRGVHFRTDHPDPDPAWRAHTELRPVLADESVESVEVVRVPVEDRAPEDATERSADSSGGPVRVA